MFETAAPRPFASSRCRSKTEEMTRRSVLAALIAAPPAAMAARQLVEGGAATDIDASPADSYRLTEHVRRYYESASY